MFHRSYPTLLPALLILSALAGCGDNGAEKQDDGKQRDTVSATPIAGGGASAGRQARVPAGKGFDFYVLALSWSPSWCLENDRSGRSSQCDVRRNHGFIVHGLWPQNERGYPEFCRSSEPERVPEALGRGLFDIMPSMGLIGHQWRKHGSCSRLSQKDYFTVLRTAREKIAMPASLRPGAQSRRMDATAVEAALIDANPGLKADAIAVSCGNGRIEEVRICLDTSLDFRSCREVDSRGCRARNLEMPSLSQ